MAHSFWVETLGCPKNQVDSDKLVGTLVADGLVPAAAADQADVVVVNTCAFIDAARQESIETVLAMSDIRRPGAKALRHRGLKAQPLPPGASEPAAADELVDAEVV